APQGADGPDVVERSKGRGNGDRTDEEQGRRPALALGRFADALQVRGAEGQVEQQARDHADRRGAEAVVPAVRIGQVSTDDVAQERAEVDAHVEDAEGAVAAGVSGG